MAVYFIPVIYLVKYVTEVFIPFIKCGEYLMRLSLFYYEDLLL